MLSKQGMFPYPAVRKRCVIKSQVWLENVKMLGGTLRERRKINEKVVIEFLNYKHDLRF